MVAHRDPWLLVVDKPAGLPSQSPRGGGENLFAQVRGSHPTATLHHRLDAGASGLLLFVLDPSVNSAIANAFRDHAIARTYVAVACGEVASGTWERPIAGKPARTDVVVSGRAHGLTALVARLHTGRTHQIRIHAALAGAPLAGDRRYGGEVGARWPRLALHASELALEHPVTGRPLRIMAPMPDDLAPLWALAGGGSDPSAG